MKLLIKGVNNMLRELNKILGISDPEFEKPLTPKRFTEIMIEIIDKYDYEDAHIMIDQIMEAQLSSMGFERGIDVIRQTERWYT